ncbi:N-acetylmuramoyl-L-alanine amidase [Camelimonas lactis]|uniref:N-acetylmuramoyl-L-alanine amidase n=1 Tax=Camelimonas lactis TaxID=659006 RepID=A0A4R2GMB5_9HYPH|nr:N-acetylmuramoyl-L-alanine amidase [Camelimonas lactis]TCO10353.1 N-acetylmuramoyl-L-alanine amidase [Camelimonas lactis]
MQDGTQTPQGQTAKRRQGEPAARLKRDRAIAVALSVALAVAGHAAQATPDAGSAVSAPPAQASAPAETRAVTNAVSVTGDNHVTTLSFTISRPVKARAFVMERPDRAVIELPAVNFQLPQGAGRHGKGLASSFRYGVFAPGKSRIVIDLAAPAAVTRVTSVQPDNALPRLEIDITRVDRAYFHKEARLAAGQGAGQAPPPAAVAPPDNADRRPVIVLDPGHGGLDNGAINSAGLVEKDIVLAFTQRLREHLEATGRYRVIMTREDDVFVSLGDRVRIAQQHRAALFLSVHADILRESPGVRGATIYTGSKLATDTESAQLADKENDADRAAGVTSQVDNDQVANILLDLTMRETRAFSNVLATRLVGGLSQVIRMNKNPHRSARFIVLTAPDTPSALLEIGYLSSTRDADLMNSPGWRDRTTAALAKAINQYFDGRRSMTAPGIIP